MFDITIRCATLADAERVLACLKHDNAPAAAQVAQQLNPPVESGGSNAQVEPPKKRGRPRKNPTGPVTSAEAEQGAAHIVAAAVAVEQESLAPVVNAAQQTLTNGDTSAKPTLADIKTALQRLLDKHHGDMAPALQVLERFGARSSSGVKEADYADFIAACEAA